MKNKFLFISTHFIPDYHYGGVVESSSNLFNYLKQLAYFTLSCVSKNPERVRKHISAEDHCYKSLYFHRFAISFDAVAGLWRDIKNADAVFINGIFTFPVTLAQIYAVIQGKPFIVSTRGGLAPWGVAYKKWKKHFYINLVTLPLMRKAAYIHVTSSHEAKSIRALGFENTITISNGIDTNKYENLPGKYSSEKEYGDKFMFLFLSRTDKEKGIDILLDAYRKFCSHVSEEKHVLFIVGPDNQHYLKKMLITYDRENITCRDGLYGEDKIKIIRRADAVLLPSYSESFGHIIAEAFACERPVITTTGTPWNMIEKIGAGYFIRPDREELFDAMMKLYKKNRNELEEMGKKGRKYIFDNFKWETKANELFNYINILANT